MNGHTIYLSERYKIRDRKTCIYGTHSSRGDLPNVIHFINVAMELIIISFHFPDFTFRFAIQIALLHDTIEDTATTFDEL